ncbi:MAG: hypothetical protein ACPGVU_23275 [Limisphaerales bacterium]
MGHSSGATAGEARTESGIANPGVLPTVALPLRPNMEDRTVNEETLKFIRHITADGIVEKDEVWDLGRFLGNNNAARSSWPGDVVWEILEGIFEDNIVDDSEAEDLTQRLQGIEKEIHTRNTPEGGIKVDQEQPFETRELSLPAVAETMEIEAVRPNDPVSTVDLQTQPAPAGIGRKSAKTFLRNQSAASAAAWPLPTNAP